MRTIRLFCIVAGALLVLLVLMAGCAAPRGGPAATTVPTTVPVTTAAVTTPPVPATTAPAATTVPPQATAPATTSTIAPVPTTGPLAETAVAIRNFAFDPATVTVKKGTTVVWTNGDDTPHAIIASSYAGMPDLNSPALQKGDVYRYTFSAAGNYGYSCRFHPSMKGTVIVTA